MRRRLASASFMICSRERPTSLGPLPIRPKTFEAITTSLRRGPSARASIVSDSPAAYTLAVSKKLIPESSDTPTMASTSGCGNPPITWKIEPLPPKVMAPKQRRDTKTPVLPSCWYCTIPILQLEPLREADSGFSENLAAFEVRFNLFALAPYRPHLLLGHQRQLIFDVLR